MSRNFNLVHVYNNLLGHHGNTKHGEPSNIKTIGQFRGFRVTILRYVLIIYNSMTNGVDDEHMKLCNFHQSEENRILSWFETALLLVNTSSLFVVYPSIS